MLRNIATLEKKTNDVVKMIIRLNSDSKNAINKILKDHNYFHSFKEENINQITNCILELKQKVIINT